MATIDKVSLDIQVVLGCTDMARSLVFYRDKLGFEAATWGEPPTFAILQRGVVTLALATEDGKPAVSRNWAAYLYVVDADATYREWIAHGVEIAEPPQDRTPLYNCRDFTIDDPDGHLLAVGQDLAANAAGPGRNARYGRDGQDGGER